MADLSGTTFHIIGGGISGLACAWILKNKHPEIRSVIYEASDCLGGRAYSYFDKTFAKILDNSLHVIIGANKFMSQFVKKEEWCRYCRFFDVKTGKVDNKIYADRDLVLKSICNTPSSDVAAPIKRNIIRSLFPFTSSRRKVWFSRGNLSQRIINILSGYADEIHLNHKLRKISSQFGLAAQLDFGARQVDIGSHDKVIIALDNLNCSKILPIIPLEHNQIINIIYQTSQTIFLPQGSSFIGVRGGSFDWLFSYDNLLSAVISNYSPSGENLSQLAMKIWGEIDKIRGVNSAFMPPFKAICVKNATIKQDDTTNSYRPDNALSKYPNVFIAGDWSMKDYPCCMETSVLSAKRAVNTALKINL